MTIAPDAERPDRSDSTSPSPPSQIRKPRPGVLRVLLRCRWFFLYVATVATMLWWYELRPAAEASRQIQGTWQAVDGVIPDERMGNSFLEVDGNETWFVYPWRDKWSVQRSRITVTPANNFFVVRRAFGYDYGTTRETEYILHIKNDELYLLRGLARLDPSRENTIEKLRRVDSLSEDARDSIEEYLNRTAANSLNAPGRSGRN